MCAAFKTSPIKPSRYKKGYGIFNRLIVTPALKLTSAAIKDVKNYGRKNKSGSASSAPTMSQAQKMDALKVREIGLQQCHGANELFSLLTPEMLDTVDGAVIMKLGNASSRYLSKGTYFNVDFYTFAREFLSAQLESVKRPKTKMEYERALELLQQLMNGKSAKEVFQSLASPHITP